jgi:hypothetical protein
VTLPCARKLGIAPANGSGAAKVHRVTDMARMPST